MRPYQLTKALLKMSSASCSLMVVMSWVSTDWMFCDEGKSAKRVKVCVKLALAFNVFSYCMFTEIVNRFFAAASA